MGIMGEIGGDRMINKKALLLVSGVLVSALVLSGLAISGTVRSEVQTTANSDMNIYLNIDNISGESVALNHTGWIDIEAFNWSEAESVLLAGRAAGLPTINDFVFVTQTSKASPKLFLAVAIGQVFKYAKLECWTTVGEASQVEFLEFKFNNVIITSYSIAGSAPQYRPFDQFSIAFGKITMTYWPINTDGTQGPPVSAYYDLTRNQGA
jgi:type VI secretion system secreted protein Hcp